MKIFSSLILGPYELKNRIVMAPMTRNRAGRGNVATDLNAKYYAQRASAGLIITEASQISLQGVSYPNTPGIYSAEQVSGWKQVTDAIHKLDGKIFIQIFHGGRISHPVYNNGELPVAPSPIKPDGEIVTPKGKVPFVTPRELKADEIPDIISQFQNAAQNALLAGFDGIELHAANGYLLDQFLCDGTNKRSDQYGGSIENRSRLLFEVIKAIMGVCSSDRIGIRFSPSGLFNSMYCSEPVALFDYVINKLNSYDLAYVHLIEPLVPVNDLPKYLKEVTPRYRKIYSGTLITNGGYNRDKGNKVIEDGIADLVSFGQLFIANPDLPERFKANAPLNITDTSKLYGGDEKGYTDYPTMQNFEL